MVYYETDTSSTSTSDSDEPSVTSKRQERKKFSKIPLHYSRISKHAPLLSVPLGKPPTFDGEDYARWSDLMRFHLTSLHKSIWDVVEFGVQVPSVGDEDYDVDEVAQIEHFNSQATTILLASLSREEYNKVQGLKSAKEVWDVLKTAHEGDELTKITKRETIEGELGRFRLNKGEEPQHMYNRLIPEKPVPPRGTPRVPAPLPLSPFSPPDRDRRGDSPAWSGRGSRPSRRTSG